MKNEAKQKFLLAGNTNEGRSGESTSSNYSIEMGRPMHPSWGNLFDDTTDKIKEVKDLSLEIQKLGSKRVRMTFGDTSSLEK